jgi:outer membrane lipoprotein SlyB
MKSHPFFRMSSLCAALAAVTIGVAAPASWAGPEGPPAAPHASPSAFVGSVVSIDPIRTRPKGSGVGAVAGGVAGGVIAHEVFGSTLGTVAGAAGGAVLGNNLERNHREGVAGYHVHVRLDNGRSRTITQTHIGDLRVGDRVRLDGGRVHRI